MKRTARAAGVHVHLGTVLYTDLDSGLCRRCGSPIYIYNESESVRTALNKFHEEALKLGLHVS